LIKFNPFFPPSNFSLLWNGKYCLKNLLKTSRYHWIWRFVLKIFQCDETIEEKFKLKQTYSKSIQKLVIFASIEIKKSISKSNRIQPFINKLDKNLIFASKNRLSEPGYVLIAQIQRWRRKNLKREEVFIRVLSSWIQFYAKRTLIYIYELIFSYLKSIIIFIQVIYSFIMSWLLKRKNK